MVATSQPLVARNDNTLHLELPAGLGAMRADQAKVRQILLNLVGNAAKFTTGGSITLAVDREPGGAGDGSLDPDGRGTGWIRFRVADTGIGIAPARLEQLFEPFVQADPSATR